MSILSKFAIFAGVALVLTALSLARVFKTTGRPQANLIFGTLFQSALLGLIVGFLTIPNAPPPPALDGPSGLTFVLSIVLIETVRSGVLLRFRFLPQGYRQYRLAALRLHRDSVDKRVRALEAAVEAERPVRGKPSAGI